ncbi:MAG TPA: cysteine--tRNA ligase [Actinomycetota bacterium]|nr:cysteine--tRNA ligase [Actinomycetota bacterium]
MRLYNTLTRRVEEVVPLEDRRIRMYTCGPTVYRYAHLGNLRTFLLADLVRRALEFEGYEVFQVMNITDVGHMTDESSPEAIDKMLLAAEDEGLSPREIAEKYTEAFLEDAAAIGIQPAHVYPRATEHIPEMLELTERLVERGHAYVVEGGTVYYDVRSFPGYGKLSGNTLDKLRPGHRDLETDPRKRHHADFALWKAAGPGRLMKWPSPWGEGFPGWHIECSAMSMKYLGERFDLHTGGVDLIFPHHEDEIAQSEGATGHQVVSTWVHGGHLRLSGQKIAKSAGNVVRVHELAERGFDPRSYRYLTFQTRYRSEMDFSWEAMAAADEHVKRLRRRMAEWKDAPRPAEPSEAGRGYDRRFRAAVADDLDLPEAVKVLNELVKAAEVAPGEKYALLSSWDRVLGLDLEREAREGFEVPAEVRALLEERDAARRRRDFATSDAIRARLVEMGFEVQDTAGGTVVRPRT